jgi:AraC family transcriptional regulator of adaptative response/methylated-DNA-[protein]-cysteine methyltransferase
LPEAGDPFRFLVMSDTTQTLSSASRDYERIELAIRYLEENFQSQPDLEEVAAAVDLSPYHFHRLFSRWVGTTPKRFLQFLTVDYVKDRLRESSSVMEAAWDAGLSGGSRLHDLMVTVEAVTPGEFKQGGTALVVRWGVHPSPFGDCVLGVTDRGLCALEFLTERSSEEIREELRRRWPGAEFQESPEETSSYLLKLFPEPGAVPRGPFTLLIKGTNFQLQVWQALVQIPPGHLTSYGAIAKHLDRPGASRAVGQAVGWNPISYLIPCHRVIQSAAAGLGGYRWGLPRKQAMLAWEAAATRATSPSGR